MPPSVKYTSESDLESVFSAEVPKKSGKQPTKEKYACTFPGCTETFRRATRLDQHEYKHTGVRKHICFYTGCDKSYTIITHLKRHINIYHEKVNGTKVKEAKCRFEFCEKTFVSIDNMERHIREVHENPKVYKCDQCEEKFTQKLKLRRHEIKHTGVFPFNCSKCSKGFVQRQFLQRHICKCYECEQCNNKFQKWSQLVAHRKESGHSKTHKCDVCEREFPTKFRLNEHKNSHDDDREVFKCDYENCTRFYTTKRNLYQHIRTAHEGVSFSCTVEKCEKVFTSKRAMQNHVNAIHTKGYKKPKQPKKPRTTRKDAGKRKQSTLSKLSGVVLDKNIDKMIMEGTAEIEIEQTAIEEEINSEVNKAADDSEVQDLLILAVKE